MWRAILLLAAGSMLVGCGASKPAPERPEKPVVVVDPTRPEDTLYEQLRAGAFQLTGVIETLDAAIDKLKEIPPQKNAETKAALADLAEAVDAAGALIADYTDEPDRVRLGKVFPEYDERRIRGIDAANDALHELEDGASVAADLMQAINLPALQEVADLLDLAISDTKDAIEALGGKVEAPAA